MALPADTRLRAPARELMPPDAHATDAPGFGHNGGPPLVPRRRGRPSIDTPELREQLHKLLLSGKPLARVCRMRGMPSKATLRAWRRRDLAFDRAMQFSQWEGYALLLEGVKDEIDRQCAAGVDPKLIRGWFSLRRWIIDTTFPVPPRNPLDLFGWR